MFKSSAFCLPLFIRVEILPQKSFKYSSSTKVVCSLLWEEIFFIFLEKQHSVPLSSRVIAVHSGASHRHRDAFLPAWGNIPSYMSILLLHLLALPSHVLERSPCFAVKYILGGHWAGCLPDDLELTEYVKPLESPDVHFSSCARPRVLPDTDNAAGRSRGFCRASQTQVPPVVSLLQVCCRSFFTHQRKEAKATWCIHSSQPLPSPNVERSCQGKEPLSVIFQTPLFISHSFDKLLALSATHSISMLERSDKSLKV